MQANIKIFKEGRRSAYINTAIPAHNTHVIYRRHAFTTAEIINGLVDSNPFKSLKNYYFDITIKYRSSCCQVRLFAENLV